MPQNKQPESLQKLCLRNVANNIDKVWLRKVDEEFTENPGKFVLVLGPFSHLTGEQTQELLNLLAEKTTLRKSHIHMLLSHRLKTLDLRCCSSVANRDATLRLVPARCQSITYLNVSGCGWASPAALTEMVSGLHQLRRLEVAHTKTSDRVVAAIADACTQLRILNLFACPVTTTGAHSLCGKGSNGPRGCLDLVNLDIAATRICMKGAMELIRSLPNLQHLHFEDSVEAIGRLYRNGFMEDQPLPEKRLQLKALYASGMNVEETSLESFQVVAAHCPFVTEVILQQDITNETLRHLRGLKHLQKLEVTCHHEGEVTFAEGLSPLLKELGAGLVSLGVFDVADLDIAAVGLLCPNLARLQCVMTRSSPFGEEEEPPVLTEKEWDFIFCSLRDLNVTKGVAASPSFSTAFSHLLKNASGLEQLHLSNVQCFTDGILNDALLLHGFKALKTLHLKACDFVTEHSIGQLVRGENALNHLALIGCHSISRKDFMSLCTYARCHNLALTVEWE